MNVAKIYSDSVGRVPQEPKQESKSPAADAARLQALTNWLESTITQELFKTANERINALVEQAITAASSYPTTKDSETVIQELVRADELRKLMNTYANRS